MVNEEVISKIQKLLRLSQSSNVHEAALAAARAADLMLKYEIDEASVAGAEDKPEEPVGLHSMGFTGKKNRVIWKGTLASGIARAFGCRIWWSGTEIKFVGRKQDLDATMYLWQVLLNEIEQLVERSWEQEGYEHGYSSKSWKSSFRLGAAEEIRARLVDQRKQTFEQVRQEGAANSSTALVVVAKREEAVDRYYKEQKKAWGLGGAVKASFRSRGGYEAGREAGRGVNLGGRSAALGGPKPQLR